MARPAREEITRKVIELIHMYVPELEHAELSEESKINTDASVDSMSLILVITKAESTFDVKIPKEQWDVITTLGELVDAIEGNLPQ